MTMGSDREHVLEIAGLRAGVSGKEIVRGIDLTVRSGEVHAVMGPNGSGKSTLAHVLMGRPGYEVLGGSVTLDGVDLLALAPWQRAHAGLFLALQYPTEVPGVSLHDLLETSARAAGRPAAGVAAAIRAEAELLALDPRLIDRPLNVDLSGGEKKKNETLQLGVLRPAIAVLDELDSGLDVDALRATARRIEAATELGRGRGDSSEVGLGVLAITHYNRLLYVLRADHVHVLAKGTIVRSGGPELALELEEGGYAGLLGAELAGEVGQGQQVELRPAIDDPFGGPGPAGARGSGGNGDGDDPFADPLAGG
jgi:Fe-S cluster assembly ATP-binding protein